MPDELQEIINLLGQAAEGKHDSEKNTRLTDPDIQLLLEKLVFTVEEGDYDQQDLEAVYDVLTEYRKEAEDRLKEESEDRYYALFVLATIYEVEADLAAFLGRDSEELFTRSRDYYDQYFDHENTDRSAFDHFPWLHCFGQILRGGEFEAKSRNYESRIQRKKKEYLD